MNNDLSLNDADEARLDRAIDRAVRDMMQLDPPPGLRRRVLSRLNQSGERRRHWLPRFAFAAAAAVVVLLSATRMCTAVMPQRHRSRRTWRRQWLPGE